MSNFKFWLGLLLVISGVAFGIYVGIWICFVGGIVDIVQGAGDDHISKWNILWGILKIKLAFLVGLFSSLVLIIPGTGLISVHGN